MKLLGVALLALLAPAGPLGSSVEAAGAAGASRALAVRPDLRVSSLANPPERVSPGASFHASDTTANVGSGRAAASVTGYYLVSSQGKSDLLGQRDVPALASGGASSGGASVRVPAGLPHGLYELRACADALHKVHETNETNNCRTAAKKLDIAPPPAPVIKGTTPGSPAPDTTPDVFGHASSGLTVRVFTNSSCSGSPAATGSPAAFSSPGLQVTLANDTTSSLSADAVDAADKVSACSGSVSYTDNSFQETEPNNTQQLANDITGHSAVFGSINPGNDDDWFKLTLTSGETEISANTADTSDSSHRCENGTLDSVLTLYDSAGNAIASNDDGSDSANPTNIGTCSSLTVHVMPSGTYYLEVTGHPPRTFPYRLNVTVS